MTLFQHLIPIPICTQSQKNEKYKQNEISYTLLFITFKIYERYLLKLFQKLTIITTLIEI